MGARKYEVASKVDLSGCLLEIGSERGEGSTSYLHKLSVKRKVPFFTVDFDPHVHAGAVKIHAQGSFNMKGEDFLSEVFPYMGLSISFAYLDNFDWIWKGMESEYWIEDQAERYSELGSVLNNEESQQAHLQQALLVDKYSSPVCHVLFDDTWRIEGGTFSGKGGLGVPALLELGYNVTDEGSTGPEVLNGFVLLKKG